MKYNNIIQMEVVASNQARTVTHDERVTVTHRGPNRGHIYKVDGIEVDRVTAAKAMRS